MICLFTYRQFSKIKHIRPLATASIALILNACITQCKVETYYQPSVPNPTDDVKVNVHQDELWLTLRGQAIIHLHECGWAYRRPDKGPVNLCLEVMPEVGVSAQLESGKFQLRDPANADLGAMWIKKFEYSIFCEESDKGPKCTSDETSVGAAETARRKNYGVRTSTIWVEVSANAPWRSALDSQHGYLGPRETKLRHYFGTCPFPQIDTAEITVVMPAIILDGRRVALPDVVLRRVTESHCGTFA